MSRGNADSLFNGIQFDSGSNLTTDANKLNFQAGFVKEAGGLIKGYQDKEEANKLTNFNNALLDMTNKGDEAGLQQLASYSDQFRDATTKQQAREGAVKALGATSTSNLQIGLQDELAAGNFDGALEKYKGLVTSPYVSPEQRLKFSEVFAPKLRNAETESIIKSGLSDWETQRIDALKRAGDVLPDVFQEFPQLTEAYSRGENGSLIEKDFPTEIELARQYKAENPKLADAEILARATKTREELATSRATLEPLLGTALKARGIDTFNLDSGNLEKAIQSTLLKKGRSLEEARTAGKLAVANGLANQALSEEAKVALATTQATITQRRDEKLALHRAESALTTKFTEPQLKNAIEISSKTEANLWEKVKEFDKFEVFGGDREDIKKVLTPMFGVKIKLTTGQERVPEPAEFMIALDRLSNDHMFTDAKSIDLDKLKTTVSAVMNENAGYNTVVKENALQALKDNAVAERNINARATAELLRATQQANANIPGSQIEMYNRIIKQAGLKTGQVAALDPANAATAAGTSVPVENAAVPAPASAAPLTPLQQFEAAGRGYLPTAMGTNQDPRAAPPGGTDYLATQVGTSAQLKGGGGYDKNTGRRLVSQTERDKQNQQIDPNSFIGKLFSRSKTEPTQANLNASQISALDTIEPNSKDATAIFDKLIQAESKGKHFDKSGKLTTSDKGAEGITQVMPKTGAKPGYGVKPIQNKTEAEFKRFGKEYFEAMLKEFNGNAEQALAAYNAGPGNVNKAIEKALSTGIDWKKHLPKPEETIPYINKIVGTNYKVQRA